MASTGAYLFGRRTYEIMARHWPTAPADDPFAAHLNSTAKYVASTTLRETGWRHSSLLQGDVPTAVARLEQAGGAIAVLGSGTLVQTLMQHDLVDEYSLTVSPLVIGSGRKLFRDAEQVRRLRLVDCTPTTTGSVMLTYRPA